MLTKPRLTSCAYCEWELAVATDAEKQRRETAHAAVCRYAPHPSVEAVTGLVAEDPSHAADVAEIVAAIELDASANSGEVNPNRVRQLLPSHVLPQAIGAVYSTLLRQGRLSEIGWTTNNDRRGRNDGKPIRLYSYDFAKDVAP
jgi:hypothetical protein